MKRFLILILCAGILMCLCACGKDMVSKEIVNTEYTPAYDAMETVYEYKWDWWHGDFVYVPNLKQVHHEEVFKVQYKITYSDGSEETCWEEVDKELYEKALAERSEESDDD